MIAIGIALGFAILYFLLQLYYFYFWIKTPVLRIPQTIAVSEKVTIVIVARNEAHCFDECLQGLLRQDYPTELFEIIVVDDHSADTTVEIIRQSESSSIRLFQLKNYPSYIKAPAFKKSGISLAVDHASYDNIIVTDADCIHPENWLRTMMYSLSGRQAVFQTAPVILHPGKSMFEKMQEVEQLTLMLITGAGITSGLQDMANGANMAFRKSAFLAVNGYEDNTQYASGDDMFLIEKMRKTFPDNITFVKSIDTAVLTKAKNNWSSLLKQRLRWAGKNNGLENKTIQRIWLFIGAYHVAMILALLAVLLQIISVWPFIMLLCVKWTVDYILVATAAAFFQRTTLLRYVVPLQFFYSYYVLRLGMMIMMGKKGDWEEGRKAEGRKGGNAT